MGAVAAATAVVASGAFVPAGAQSGSVPGVSAKEIQVGALLALTNPTGIEYKQVADGAQAYFDQVNKDGGVFGKKLKVVKVIDDQSRTSKDLLGARSLVEESKVFAAFVASQTFAGADVFAKAGTPTFGYNIQTDWSKGPNLFGTYGSYLCLTDCPQWPTAFVAQQLGAKHVAVFAYGSSPQSADCANVTQKAFDKWGPKVAVFDTSLSFGFSANDISGAVQAMKDAQVDYVTTCMDLQGVLNLKKAAEAAGLQGVHYYAPQGYDADNLEQLGSELDGFTFLAQFVPFESAKGNPGMTEFLKAMKAKGHAPSENYLVGWIGAKLLVQGIKDSGKNFTQQSVVDAINKTTDWTSDGMMAPVNWTTAHGPAAPGDTDCVSFLAPENGKFVPKYGQPGKPMVCFPVNPYPATLANPTYFGG
ncbi:MAG: ABC transporter substrate-binding protein [Acidimicrobiia bacterium]